MVILKRVNGARLKSFSREVIKLGSTLSTKGSIFAVMQMLLAGGGIHAQSQFCGGVMPLSQNPHAELQLESRNEKTRDSVINILNLHHPRTTHTPAQKDSLTAWTSKDFAGYKNAHGSPISFKTNHVTIPLDIADIIDKIEKEDMRTGQKNLLLTGEAQIAVVGKESAILSLTEQQKLGQRLRMTQDKYGAHITSIYIPNNGGNSRGIRIDQILLGGYSNHLMINIVQTDRGIDINGKQIQHIGLLAQINAKGRLRSTGIHEIGHNVNLGHADPKDARGVGFMNPSPQSQKQTYLFFDNKMYASVTLGDNSTITNYNNTNTKEINEKEIIQDGLLKILENGRTDKVTSTLEPEESKNSVFPNPTVGNLTVELTDRAQEALGRGKLFMSLISMQGQVVNLDIEQESGANELELNVDHLPNGIYTLRVFNQQGNVDLIKFIVHK